MQENSRPLEKMSFLVFWYGEEKGADYYSLVPFASFIPYENVTKKMLDYAKNAEKKSELKKTLTHDDKQRLRGMAQFNEDLAKEPKDRRRGDVVFQEGYELLSLNDIDELKLLGNEDFSLSDVDEEENDSKDGATSSRTKPSIAEEEEVMVEEFSTLEDSESDASIEDDYEEEIEEERKSKKSTSKGKRRSSSVGKVKAPPSKKGSKSKTDKTAREVQPTDSTHAGRKDEKAFSKKRSRASMESSETPVTIGDKDNSEWTGKAGVAADTEAAKGTSKKKKKKNRVSDNTDVAGTAEEEVFDEITAKKETTLKKKKRIKTLGPSDTASPSREEVADDETRNEASLKKSKKKRKLVGTNEDTISNAGDGEVAGERDYAIGPKSRRRTPSGTTAADPTPDEDDLADEGIEGETSKKAKKKRRRTSGIKDEENVDVNTGRRKKDFKSSGNTDEASGDGALGNGNRTVDEDGIQPDLVNGERHSDAAPTKKRKKMRAGVADTDVAAAMDERLNTRRRENDAADNDVVGEICEDEDEGDLPRVRKKQSTKKKDKKLRRRKRDVEDDDASEEKGGGNLEGGKKMKKKDAAEVDAGEEEKEGVAEKTGKKDIEAAGFAFSQNEDKFEPVLKMWRSAIENKSVKDIDRCLQQMLNQLSSLCARFIEVYKIAVYLKESRSVLKQENAGLDRYNELKKSIREHYGGVKNDLPAFDPDVKFPELLSPLNSNQHGVKKDDNENGEKGQSLSQDSTIAEASIGNQGMGSPVANGKASSSAASDGQSYQAPSEEAPLTLDGKKEATDVENSGWMNCAVSVQTSDPQRLLGLEFLLQMASHFPDDKVKVDSIAVLVEKAIFDWAGSKVGAMYWERLHAIAAGICGDSEPGSLMQQVLNGEIKTAKELVLLPDKKLYASFLGEEGKQEDHEES